MTARDARGFTLLEMTLASVIAGMVLIVVGGLFASLNVADRASQTALSTATEFSMTQGTIRRSFLRLVMAADREIEEGESLPRPRLLLEADAAAQGAPRFEVVVSRPPVGSNLATTAAEWAFAASDEASLNFVSADGSGGQERGVFELRPDGERELVMAALGLESAWWDPPTPEQLARVRDRDRSPTIRPASYSPGGAAAALADPGTTWTLWYRRMIPEEVALLDQGYETQADGLGDLEVEARRLAGAVRLATGLTEAQWRVYKGDEWLATDYSGLMVRDLPAFVQFRARSRNGNYGEWLFEIAWTEAENVATDDEASYFGGAGSDGQGPPDAGTGDGDGGTRDDIPDATRPPANDSTRPGDLPEAGGDTASGGTSATVRDGRNR